MRIAVWFNLPSGGAKRALRYQVRGLLEAGHEVEIWCPPVPDADFMPLDDLASIHVLPMRNVFTPENPGPAAPHLPGRIRQAAILYQEWLAELDRHAQKAAADMARHGFEVLLAHNCWMIHTPFIGRHFCGKKLLYLHEPKRRLYENLQRSVWRPLLVPQGTRFPARMRAIIRDNLSLYGNRRQVEEETRNALAFDRILVNSYFSRESVLRAFGVDSRVCYLGVDTDLFQPEGAVKERFVVGLGHIAIPKNIEFVIHAVALLPKPRPRLVWIGNKAEGEYVRMLQSAASASDVPFEIRVMSSDKEVAETLASAAVLAYAPRLEPFGFAPLEANACGTVAVVVAEGGLRESVVDGVNGNVVDPTPRALADALAPYLNNLELARSAGLRARAHVCDRWGLKAAAERLELQIREVCSGEQE